jgi:Zn-dependent protease
MSLLHYFDFGTITKQFAVRFFTFVINIALALFNVIPIPPLDGHWMLCRLLTRDAAAVFKMYEFLCIHRTLRINVHVSI